MKKKFLSFILSLICLGTIILPTTNYYNVIEPFSFSEEDVIY